MRLLLVLLIAWYAAARADDAVYPPVVPGVPLVFPRDYGSHPAFRTEWWYATAWVQDEAGRAYGVQVTFFRNRPGVAEESASAFAPRQLLFAHAAVADIAQRRLLHVQRSARAGFGLVQAGEGDTDVALDDWHLRREADRYQARIAAAGLALDLTYAPTQAPLLQGDRGYSRKGPDARQASYYYSVPQLAVAGTLTIAGAAHHITGRAWLDHEWSSQALAEDAAGWDWTGINLDDGAALMAFRIRDRRGGVLWAGGSYRDAGGAVRTLRPDEVRFQPLRQWRSPRSGSSYPVSMRVTAGDLTLELQPAFADQEFDARASTGTIYWEGAVYAHRAGRAVGRGYLELTGYGQRLRLD